MAEEIQWDGKKKERIKMLPLSNPRYNKTIKKIKEKVDINSHKAMGHEI